MYDEAIDLLYSNLHALPDPEYGVINMLPYAHDSDHVSSMKRRVATAVINLLANAGFQMEVAGPPAKPVRQIRVHCRSCSGDPLFTTVADSSGSATVDGPSWIDSISQRQRECPHKVLTLNDQRMRIEQMLRDESE